MSEFWRLEPGDYDKVAALHEEPMFLPWDHLRSIVLPGIFVATVCVTILYSIIYYFVDLHYKKFTPFLKRKGSYQFTNLVVNGFLGIIGTYHFIHTLPENATVEQQVGGLEELYFFPCLQIAFQLWSIPMGLFFVGESPSMIGHHFAVIMVAAMPGFFTIGARYWTPFFFGIVELSSVPLAVMNTFKDNQTLRENNPGLYLAVRLWFMFSFLGIRWIMYMPRKYVFLAECMWALQSSDVLAYKIYMFGVWISSFFLACLQCFWGCLILRGFIKVVFSAKPKKKQA